MSGKTIRLYLVDGVATGVLTAEIINWTGMVIVAPRAQLAALAQRSEVKRTGIYCLAGADPESPHRDRMYIGEGDNVFVRLTAHDKDETKDFWTRAVIVTSKDENLTKSHSRYLESRLISMAHEAGRAVVTNGSAPPLPSLPEPDSADMEYFLAQVQLMLPVLGFSFLQPKPALIEFDTDLKPATKFVMRDAGTEAYAAEINGEFVVLKGSTARKHGTKSWDSYKELRDQLVQDGTLVDAPSPDLYQFADNVPFASPSAAAATVAAGNRNGRMTWKVKDSGQTYAEWQEAKLAKTGSTNVTTDE
jgi:hypothetical protein